MDVPLADQLPGGQNFYWPLSAVVTKDLATGTDLVLLFLAQMYDRNLKQLGSSDPTWDFAQVSSRLATYSVAADGTFKLLSLTRTPMADVAPGRAPCTICDHEHHDRAVRYQRDLVGVLAGLAGGGEQVSHRL